MERCPRCGRRFVVTSWTANNKWRKFCPRCIVEGLELLMEKLPAKQREEWRG